MSDVSTHSTLPTSLVAYYELEEASGSRADSKGSNTLTDNNTVTSATGKQGDAAVMVIANSEYLSTTTMWHTAKVSVSYSVWVKFTSTSVTEQTILTVGRGTSAVGADRGHSLILNGQGKTDGTVSILDHAIAWHHSTKKITDTNWHHIAVTVDSSSISRVYLDNAAAWVDGVALSGTPTSSGCALGFEQGTARRFGGTMDEVGIWTKTLTSGEVSDLWAGGAGLPYSSGGATNTTNFFYMT